MISTEQINQLVADEYKRASERFGETFNSSHEAYASISEECVKPIDAGRSFEYALGRYRCSLKLSRPINANIINAQKLCLTELQEIAEKAIAEWIQVATMCHKASLTLQGGE